MRTTTSQQGKRCTWWRCLSSSFATALLAAAPLVASAQTGDGTRNDGMVGVATLEGQTEAQIVAAEVGNDLVGSLDDPSKVFFLTSSLRHPKILIKEFSYFLMPCHQHGLRINLLV